MQHIQILTRDDVARIVEGEMDRRLRKFQAEMIDTLKQSMAEVIRAELPAAMGRTLDKEMRTLQQGIVQALGEAIERVISEASAPTYPSQLDHGKKPRR